MSLAEDNSTITSSKSKVSVIAETFGRRMSEAMRKNEVSDEEISAALGIKVCNIAAYRNGRTHPRFENGLKIAAFLEFSLDGIVDKVFIEKARREMIDQQIAEQEKKLQRLRNMKESSGPSFTVEAR